MNSTDITPAGREPVFNIPGTILALIGVLVGVHLLRTWLALDSDVLFLREAAFVPARLWVFLDSAHLPGVLAQAAEHGPGQDVADRLDFARFFVSGGGRLWTLVTYAFLHASFTHLTVNGLWLLAFGSPVARRFGPARFLALFLAGSVAGALAHFATHVWDAVPLVGASAGISAFMAAATRFMFGRRGPLMLGSRGRDALRQPAPPLREVITDSRVIIFLIVWFGTNLIFGVAPLSFAGSEGAVAWQAHVGGFIAGFVLFPFLDPVGRKKNSSF